MINTALNRQQYMGAISLSLSAAFLPHDIHHSLNNRAATFSASFRCVSVSPSKVIKSQLRHVRRQQSIFSGDRTLTKAMAEDSRSAHSPAAVPNSVPVRVAHELIQAGHRYLDVRTTEEFDAGHVVGAFNVPYMLRTGSGMDRNPKFLQQVSNHFGKDDEIIVGCQVGKRSLMAASELMSAGFTGITDMAGGYAAWIQNGLPTTE